MATKFWSGVGVTIESARAAADTITAITKANPAVVSSTSHGLNDGDYVLISCTGMWQLNNRIVKVANKTADTFECSGVNSTSYDTFSAGSAYALTFGTSLATATNVNATGGEPEFADVTTIHERVRTQVPVVTSPETFSFESLWDPSDAGLLALKSYSDALSPKGVKFTFADSSVYLFYGYISASLSPTGAAQEVVKTNVTITAFGRPQVYA